MTYCYKCFHENIVNSTQCAICGSSIYGFFDDSVTHTKELADKANQFFKSKDYANFIYASSLLCWYNAIELSILDNKIKIIEFVARHIMTPPRMTRAFKYLNKTEALEKLNQIMLELFKNFEVDFHTVFKSSNFYQNPFAWDKFYKDRVNPNDFIKGETSRTRVLRLMSKDKECILSINRLLSYDAKLYLKNEIRKIIL